MIPARGASVISEDGLPPHFTVLIDISSPGLHDGSGEQWFWCDENCVGDFWVLEYYDFLFELYEHQKVKFFFVDENDALSFKLRFG